MNEIKSDEAQAQSTLEMKNSSGSTDSTLSYNPMSVRVSEEDKVLLAAIFRNQGFIAKILAQPLRLQNSYPKEDADDVAKYIEGCFNLPPRKGL